MTFLQLAVVVGLISLAGVEPGLWQVRGGNKLVPAGLLKLCDANLIQAQVSEVSYSKKHSKFYVTAATDVGGSRETTRKDYDALILATPVDVWSKIKFSGIPSQSLPQYRKYIRRYTYFFSGTPNASYFGLENVNDFPDVVLTCGRDFKLSSLGKHLPIDYKQGDKVLPVYKIFTNEPLTETEINEIFPLRDAFELVDWTGAYPVYASDVTTSSFELMSNLYYVNAIEMAASAMEMSAIGGRNVALLVKTRWLNEFRLIDPEHLLLQNKTTNVNEEL